MNCDGKYWRFNMGKPRSKGMRKGYLKRFSSQAINGGRYSPKTTSKAEEARPKRSAGFGKPDVGVLPPPLPPTQGATHEVRERVKKWEVFVRNERHQIKPEDIKFAPKLSNGVPLPIGPDYLCFVGNIWFWFHKQEGNVKRSITYHSATRAEHVFLTGTITWNTT
jgi:hypothetical protein